MLGGYWAKQWKQKIENTGTVLFVYFISNSFSPQKIAPLKTFYVDTVTVIPNLQEKKLRGKCLDVLLKVIVSKW